MPISGTDQVLDHSQIIRQSADWARTHFPATDELGAGERFTFQGGFNG